MNDIVQHKQRLDINKEELCSFHETVLLLFWSNSYFVDVSILRTCHLGETEPKAAVKVKQEQEDDMTPESFMKEQIKDMSLHASYHSLNFQRRGLTSDFNL